MTEFLQFWDRIELGLATLPFPVQVTIMLVVGVPVFFVVAVGVEKVADMLVHGFRALAGPRPSETGKEVG